MNTTAFFDVEFEVRGAFNASDWSVDIYIMEVWAEGVEVVVNVDGVVLEGVTDEFFIFTTNSYEYRTINFPPRRRTGDQTTHNWRCQLERDLYHHMPQRTRSHQLWYR